MGVPKLATLRRSCILALAFLTMFAVLRSQQRSLDNIVPNSLVLFIRSMFLLEWVKIDPQIDNFIQEQHHEQGTIKGRKLAKYC